MRRVANHTSGVTTFVQNRFGAPRNFTFRGQNHPPLRLVFWPPGDHFDYSNLGYGILGEVVGRVSGKATALSCAMNFSSLGMTDASLGSLTQMKSTRPNDTTLDSVSDLGQFRVLQARRPSIAARET